MTLAASARRDGSNARCRVGDVAGAGRCVSPTLTHAPRWRCRTHPVPRAQQAGAVRSPASDRLRARRPAVATIADAHLSVADAVRTADRAAHGARQCRQPAPHQRNAAQRFTLSRYTLCSPNRRVAHALCGGRAGRVGRSGLQSRQQIAHARCHDGIALRLPPVMWCPILHKVRQRQPVGFSLSPCVHTRLRCASDDSVAEPLAALRLGRVQLSTGPQTRTEAASRTSETPHILPLNSHTKPYTYVCAGDRR